MQKIFPVALLCFVLLSSCFTSCENDNNTIDEPTALNEAPQFNADNAFAHIEKQLSFGPRVPGTAGQKNCAAFLKSEIAKYVDTVYVQETTVTQPISENQYPCINIIGSIHPDALYRVLVLAHWDTRPWADMDDERKAEPILGADDGASGCAVMLEVARAIKESDLELEDVGVDFLFVDVEDVGKTEWSELSYSLGTQYWAQNPHVSNYKANYGMCLDMVGAKNAQFLLEGFSKRYADDKQRNIWDIANKLGYGQYFLYQDGGAITDDHVVVNEMANIPCVDIINLQEGGSFGKYWHTHDDDIDIIDKRTLKAVGQTVLQVLYEE
jgi:Zn-dependent M28 family amino/carboxypeptidase